MWIDINAHVGHWPFMRLKYNTCAALLERMDRFGVALSLVSNLNGIFYKNVQSANEELFEEISSKPHYSGRLVPFATINPIYAGWRDDLERSVGKLGMKGVRIYPAYHDYALTDPACLDLVRRVRDMGLPVAVSLRMVDSRQRSWMDIEQEWSLKEVVPLIQALPDAKYLFLNLANRLDLSEDEELLMKRTDFLLDTSGRSLTNLGALLRRFGKERFAMGSHSPILDYLTGQLRIESLQPAEAEEEVKELLRFGNARSFLGL